MMNEKEMLSVVTGYALESAGYADNEEEAESRTKALDYYFQRPRGDEIEGRSRVVSGDLSAMVEANVAQMMASFSSDRVAEFQAENADDEDQAQLETDIVTDCLMDDNDGYIGLETSIKDALLLRNGVMKAYPRTESEVVYKELDGVTLDAYAALSLDDAPGVEVLKYDEATGYLKTRTTMEVKKLCVEPVERFIIKKDWTSNDLSRVPYCGQVHQETRSDMISLRGFSRAKVDKLSVAVNPSGAQMARNPGSRGEVGTHGQDPSQDVVEWVELYVLVDKDGDGVAERRKVCFVPNQDVLEDVEAPLVPYVSGSVLINPHRRLGISLYDKLKQVQDVNTGLTRGLMNNVASLNDPRFAYDSGKVNQDDMDSGVLNGNLRVKVPTASQGVGIGAFLQPLPVVDATAGIMASLQSQNRTRSELGGAALDMSNGNSQLSAKVGSEGLDRAYSVMEQLAALMTKNVGETLIKGLYKLIHDTYRLYFSDDISNKKRGEWLTSNPQQWPKRNRVTIKVGQSAGERSRKAAALRQVLSDQVAFSNQGLDDVLVNVNGFYKTLMDWCRVSEIENPEQYFVNPNTEEAKAAMQGVREQKAKQGQAQQYLTQRALKLEELSIMLANKQKKEELDYKYFDTVLGAEMEEGKITGNFISEVERQKLGALYGQANKQRTSEEGSETAP